jgi:hypothetical protein
MSDVELDYVEESGPGVVDLSQAPAEEQVPADGMVVEAPPQLWEQETIEKFLQGTGVGLHMLAGAGEKDWLMTKADLERIAPPLTRIANRYEPLARLSPYGDPLLVAHGFALYGWRSALERKRAMRDAEEEAGPGDGYERVDVDEPIDQEQDVGVDEEPGLAFPESPRAQP